MGGRIRLCGTRRASWFWILRELFSYVILGWKLMIRRMIAIALLALTIFHPGKYFPVMRKGKRAQNGQNDLEQNTSIEKLGSGSESEAPADANKA